MMRPFVLASAVLFLSGCSGATSTPLTQSLVQTPKDCDGGVGCACKSSAECAKLPNADAGPGGVVPQGESCYSGACCLDYNTAGCASDDECCNGICIVNDGGLSVCEND